MLSHIPHHRVLTTSPTPTAFKTLRLQLRQKVNAAEECESSFASRAICRDLDDVSFQLGTRSDAIYWCYCAVFRYRVVGWKASGVILVPVDRYFYVGHISNL